MSILIQQRDTTDCGPACLTSIAAHFKLKISLANIRQYASTDKKGTSILGLIEAANKLGFDSKGVKGTLNSLTKIPLPAIAHLKINDHLHHYVVIYKATNKHVFIMDPSVGKMCRKTTSIFSKEWSGVLLLLLPSETFQINSQTNSNLFRFWALIKPHTSILLQVLFGAFIYTILGLSTAIFVQKITDYVLVDDNRNLLNLMSISMIIIFILQLFIGTVKNIFTIRIGQQIDAHLILGYYKHLLTLPQHFFDTMRVGEITSRINDAVKIRAFISDVSISLVVNALIITFSFLLLFSYYWKLALLMLVTIPLYLIIFLITNAFNQSIQRKLMEESAELEAQLVESLNTIGTIKQLGLEDFNRDKTEDRFISLLHTMYKSSKINVFSNSSLAFVSQMLIICLLWIGTGYVLNKEITPGELFSFYALTSYFTSPTTALVNANKSYQEAIIATDRLFEVLDLEVAKDTSKIILTPDLIGDIYFKDVAFRYGTRSNIFTNLSLTIKAGSYTAIVGGSGSGKSTLMALLHHVYPIQNGTIYIGKYALNHLNTASLRKIIGVVPQKIELFAGSVIDNIAPGEPEPSIQRILDICIQLGISEFIESLPDGFQTYLGESGATLSGGQKQRIAIARALYRNPEILILDEATSSLDTASEQYVQQAVNMLINQKKTIIVIAHRLSTIRNANHIIVLENGTVVEEGKHDQMLSKNGCYAKLWKQQHESDETSIKPVFD